MVSNKSNMKGFKPLYIGNNYKGRDKIGLVKIDLWEIYEGLKYNFI